MGPDLGHHRNTALSQGNLQGAERNKQKSKWYTVVRTADYQRSTQQKVREESSSAVSGVSCLSEGRMAWKATYSFSKYGLPHTLRRSVSFSVDPAS